MFWLTLRFRSKCLRIFTAFLIKWYRSSGISGAIPWKIRIIQRTFYIQSHMGDHIWAHPPRRTVEQKKFSVTYISALPSFLKNLWSFPTDPLPTISRNPLPVLPGKLGCSEISPAGNLFSVSSTSFLLCTHSFFLRTSRPTTGTCPCCL